MPCGPLKATMLGFSNSLSEQPFIFQMPHGGSTAVHDGNIHYLMSPPHLLNLVQGLS